MRAHSSLSSLELNSTRFLKNKVLPSSWSLWVRARWGSGGEFLLRSGYTPRTQSWGGTTQHTANLTVPKLPPWDRRRPREIKSPGGKRSGLHQIQTEKVCEWGPWTLSLMTNSQTEFSPNAEDKTDSVEVSETTNPNVAKNKHRPVPPPTENR